jgi:hypothetical protein
LYKFYFNNLPSPLFSLLSWFLSKKWFIDHIYNRYIGLIFFRSCYLVYYKTLDKGFIEFFSPTIITKLFNKCSKYSLNFQSGIIYHYVCFLFLTWFLFFIFFELKSI